MHWRRRNKYYHDVHCNAGRHQRMGCPGYSCFMYKRALKAETELEDVRLELSIPETCGLYNEPLYKWAALIVCELYRLRKVLEE